MMRVDVRQAKRLEGGRLGELYERHAPEPYASHTS